MDPLTPDDVALFVAETDQDKAAVRELVTHVRRHWADRSGCPLPKCPSGGIARELERAHPTHVKHLLLAALVLLADQPDQPPQHVPGWHVRDYLGRDHEFIGPEKAVQYALDNAWTDKPTTLVSPQSEEWVLLRRHPDVYVFAARKVQRL